jgi:hypothetical protein
LRPALLAFARLTVSFAEGGARAPRPGLRGRSARPDRRRRRLLMHRFEGGRGVNDRTTMFVSDSPGCRRRRGVAAAAWLATVYLTIVGQNAVLELTTGFYVRLPMSSLIPGVITDVAVLTLGTMLGRAIYKGRYYRVAAVVVTFVGCLWVFLLAVMIASGQLRCVGAAARRARVDRGFGADSNVGSQTGVEVPADAGVGGRSTRQRRSGRRVMLHAPLALRVALACPRGFNSSRRPARAIADA